MGKPIWYPHLVISCCFLFFASVLIQCKHAGDAKIKAGQQSSAAKNAGEFRQLLRSSDRQSDSAAKITMIRKALQQSFALGNNDAIVESIFYLTAFFFERGTFDSCAKYYKLAYTYARQPGVRNDLLPTLYLNHGTFYYLQGNYVPADSLYYLALQLANADTSLASTRFSILYNLHFTKRLTGQKQDALNYINEAKKQAVLLKDTTDQRMAWLAESDFYFEEKEINKAKASLERSFDVFRGDTSTDQCYIYANVLAAGDKPCEAVPVLKNAIQRAAGDGVDFIRLSLLTQLGMAYNKMGDHAKAVETLEPVIQETLQKNFNYNSSNVYAALEFAYEHLGNYRKALEINKLLNATHDSLLNIEKIKSMNELELKYKTAEKDKLIALDKLKIAGQHNRINQQTKWIALVSAAGILVMVFFIGYYQIKKQQIAYLKQQQEIDKLKARIQGEENERQRLARELHDGVGGLLSAVLMHADYFETINPGMQEPERFHSIRNMVSAAALEVKKSANNLIPEPVVNLGLAEAIRQFCASVTQPLGATIKVQVLGNVNSLDLPLQLTSYRIVQELVHNSLKHAKAKEILVQVARSAGLLEITVEDDGKGLEAKPSHAGMGLRNLHSRVEELRGKLSIMTNPHDGTAVNIELPVSQ